MSYFFQNSLTRENEHFEHIDSATILSLQKGSDPSDWISIFACSPKVNSEPLIYIFHPSIDSIPVNSFKQEGSPTPKANFFSLHSTNTYNYVICWVRKPSLSGHWPETRLLPGTLHRHGSYNFSQTNFKDFSRIFQG